MPQPADDARTALLRAAVRHCTAIVEAAASQVRDTLDARAQAALRPADRDLLQQAQADLSRNRARFVTAFGEALQQADGRASPTPRPDTGSSWQALTLVDDSEVEERLSADRVAQQIVQECEPQLRDLGSYMGTLLGSGRADEDRHPLRPERIGDALCKAVQQLSVDPAVRALLVREFTADVAHAMPTCYDTVIAEMEHSGVQPLPLVWRATTGHSGRPTAADTASSVTPLDPRTAPPGHADARMPAAGAGQALSGFGPAAQPAQEATRADAELMSLLRRLTDLAQHGSDGPTVASGIGPSGPLPGRHDGVPGWGPAGDATLPFMPSSPQGLEAATAHGPQSLPGVNLIHAHREALQRASPTKVDHMVIDVVGTLFDQILSDTRVSPQMARQIARLQLPVLRVAMVDAGFFSSRRHPVRRFVNRIASLACPFDDFDSGPGKAFLDRVRDLVQEIIDGDFDQPELYVAKLATLEQFVGDQHRDEPQAHAAATLFDAKESELRVQQRYRAQLQAALSPVPMEEYLRTFVSQVWSQALVVTARSDGAQSPQAQRARQVAVELVMSVQPKGLPVLRMKFLMQLPGLMKDLNAGMQLVGWPPSAQQDFFGQLLPAHAESLKAKPSSELDHNLLAKQLEAIFQAPIPLADDPFPTLEGVTTGGAEFEPRISDADAERVGLLRENAVDWSEAVDIDLGAEAADSGTDALMPDFPMLSDAAASQRSAAAPVGAADLAEAAVNVPLGARGGAEVPAANRGAESRTVSATGAGAAMPPSQTDALDIDLDLTAPAGVLLPKQPKQPNLHAAQH